MSSVCFQSFRFVDEFGVVAGQGGRIVRAEAHHVFLDAEDLEKYFRYMSFTALNSAANCSGVQ